MKVSASCVVCGERFELTADQIKNTGSIKKTCSKRCRRIHSIRRLSCAACGSQARNLTGSIFLCGPCSGLLWRHCRSKYQLTEKRAQQPTVEPGLRTYRCAICPYWHWTSNDGEHITEEYREHLARLSEALERAGYRDRARPYPGDVS